MNTIAHPRGPAGPNPFEGEVAPVRAVNRSRFASTLMPQFERYWHEALSLKFPILAIIVTSLLIGLVATLTDTPKFRATTRIEISPVDSNLTNVSALKVDDLNRNLQYYRTQYALLKSRSLAERVARRLKLATNPQAQKAFGIKADATGDVDRRIISRLVADVSIDPVQTSNLVDIRFESADPALSASIANSWANEFLNANIERRFGATVNARNFLEQRLGDVRQRLEQSERDLIGYATDKQLLTVAGAARNADGETTAAQTLVASDLAALNQALSDSTAKRLGAESQLEYSATNLGVASGADPATATLRTNRAQLAVEYAKLATQFGEEYPQVKSIKAQLDVLDRNLTQEQRRIQEGVRAEYQQALALERKLQQRVNGLKNSYLQQRQEGVRYAILQREVDTNRQIYDALLQRFKEIGVTGTGTNNMTVVDQAEVPRAPFKPVLSVNLLFWLFIGVLVSAILVFARDAIDQSLRDPADVEKILELPLLGTIPRVESQSVVADLFNKKSELYEAYFAARSSLSFLTRDGMPPRFMLTSGRANEGKSATAIALAQLSGELGKRTLLVDADLRHSGLDAYVEIPSGKGLSNYLTGEEFSAALITKIEGRAFDVMTSGRKPPNPAELLSGQRLKQLMEELRSHYDQVIIDGPPVLGLADALEISTVVDGVVFIIQSNGAKLRAIQNSLFRLEASGARIFGAIVTKLDQRNMGYGYGYGYG